MSLRADQPLPIELVVRGMRCAACVHHVEEALRRVPGVAGAVVNLMTGRAFVNPAPNEPLPRTQTLIDAVRAAGYEAEPVPHQRAAEGSGGAHRGLSRLAVACSGVIAIPLLVLHTAHLFPFRAQVLQQTLAFLHQSRAGAAAQAVLAVVVILLVGRPMLAGALRAVTRRRADMDVLVSLGAGAAMVSGVAGLIAGRPELVTFDAAALIAWFVGVGKYLEAQARQRAVAALQGLASRIPQRALRVVEGRTENIPADAVRPGDVLRVVPHATVPVDGEVVSGSGTVDESLLTGEPMPLVRGPGDPVLGGSRCVEGLFDMRAAATGAESAAARIALLVEEVQSIKPPWQRLADRVAAVFVPAVLVVAAFTFLGWLYFADAASALERAIAVLVVACPCALGLAIPTAVVVGTARAAGLGILVRDPAALEAAARLRCVVLDKTGTLTRGALSLASVRLTADADEGRVLAYAAALAQLSEHPAARAIVQAASSRGIILPPVAEFKSEPGSGLRGQVDGVEVTVGSLSWLQSVGIVIPAEVRDQESEGQASVLGVAIGKELVAVLGLADEVHPDAQAAVRELRELGVSLRVLSGDRPAAVGRVAAELGISDWEAGLTPQQKLARVSELVRSGRGVAMVGDGVNDAPALAAADVGIAFGTGADLARQAAPICVIGHSPRAIPRLVRLSRASTRIMKQNLMWAAAYNLLMLPVAAFSTLPPAWAAAAMMLSSLSVVANSLRLRRAG